MKIDCGWDALASKWEKEAGDEDKPRNFPRHAKSIPTKKSGFLALLCKFFTSP